MPDLQQHPATHLQVGWIPDWHLQRCCTSHVPASLSPWRPQIKLKGRALLPLGVHDRTVVVHDNEPTSAVALCLSSR